MMRVAVFRLLLLAVWLSSCSLALSQPPQDRGPDTGTERAANAQPSEEAAEVLSLQPPGDGDALNLLNDFFGPPSKLGDAAGDAVESARDKPAETSDLDSLDQLFGSPSLFGDSPPAQGSTKSGSGRRSGVEGEAIGLADGYQAARQLALLHQRPLVVIFGADWCVWCRKLEQELTSARADPIRRQWVIAKVDVDDEPQLAKQMDVGSLPAVRVVDTAGGVLASRTGYSEAAQLEAWLADNLEQADPSVQRVLVASGVPSKAEIAELVAMLQRRSPAVRASASRRLREHRSLAAAAVVDQFRAAALSSQLAALEILEAWDAPVDGLDPWTPDSINSDSLEPLLQWVRGIPSDSRSDQDAAADQGMDAPTAARILRQLIDAAPARRQELAQQAIAGGMEVADQAQQLLQSLDTLPDDQRQLLRQIRYQVLAGPATRIESVSLLESVARLDGPARREAASKLLQSLTSQDQPLIDELSRDSDPLVRELVVSAQSRVGALTQGDRLQRLLSDDSPSVRTAVLRQLAENPQDEVTARLVQYLNTESNEDLRVYATKTLGQLAANEAAAQALADLMRDARWRVRAAALDASRQYFEDNESGMSLFSGASRNVSSSIADGVLTALNDEDPFVVAQAAKTLPYILSRQTAERIATYMLQDEASFSAVYDSIEEYQRELRLEPLTELALKWLEGTDSQQTADAARLLLRIAPTKMRYRLAGLLKFPDPATRIVALRAIIPSLAEFRDEQIEYERALSGRVVGVKAKRDLQALPLLRPFPAAFLPPATEPKPPLPGTLIEVPPRTGLDSQTEQSGDETAAEISFDLVDDFFGTAPPLAPVAEMQLSDADEVIIEAPQSDTNLPLEIPLDGEQPQGLFDWASRLLGGRSRAERPQPRREAIDNDAISGLNRDRFGLGSYWIERWQQQHESIKRPAWIRQCQSLVAELTESQDPTEQWWAQAASLAFGETDHLVAVLQRSDTAPSLHEAPMADLVAWLPAEERLRWLQQAQINWSGPPDETWQALRAATHLDHAQAGRWVYQQVAAHQISDPQSLAVITGSLTRALVGSQAAEQLAMHSAEQLTLDPEVPLSVSRSPLVPGQLAAAQWLMSEYQQATSEHQKWVLLGALTRISRRHGITEALAIVDEAERDSPLIRLATALVLSDRRALSAERAVILLSHPVDQVAERALTRLVSIDYAPDPSSAHLSVGALHFEEPRNFAFQELKRLIPLEALQRFGSGDESSQLSAFAAALRLSAGGDGDPLEIIKGLQDWELARPLVAVALAHGGRSDDVAMQVYESCIETIDSFNAGSLYRALQKIKGEKVTALRLKLFKSHSGYMP